MAREDGLKSNFLDGRVVVMANNISDEMYEHLREILGKQNGKTYTFEEAKEIGDELLEFFELLMEFDDELSE